MAMYDFTNLATQMGMILVVALGALLIGAIAGGAIYLIKFRKKYDKYKVIVWKRFRQEDGAETFHITDISERGAVVKDKKLDKWVFHLKNANLDLGEEELESYDEDRDLDIPSIPYGKGGEVVFVEKLAQRKYAVGDPFIVEGQVKIMVTSADVAEAIRSYQHAVKTFAKKESPLLAFIIYITFAVLVLILIVVVLNKLEALSEFGDKWLEGARTMAAARSSTVPSAVPG